MLAKTAAVPDTCATMAAPSADEIEAAAARLRGHIVSTPLIGGLVLPARRLPEGLRVKPEVLQPSGSLYYRGAMHWMLRQLGALKGVALHGADRTVLAAAVAAAQHRLPMVAFTVGEPDRDVWSLLQAVGCEVSPRPTAGQTRQMAASVQASQGYRVMPGLEDTDYAAGVATVGLELGEDLPASTELVVVSPLELVEPVALGLLAAGANVRVQGVDEEGCRAPAELREEVRAALRLDVGGPGLAALNWTLEHDNGAWPCVVLAG